MKLHKLPNITNSVHSMAELKSREFELVVPKVTGMFLISFNHIYM